MKLGDLKYNFQGRKERDFLAFLNYNDLTIFSCIAVPHGEAGPGLQLPVGGVQPIVPNPTQHAQPGLIGEFDFWILKNL